MAVKYLLNTPIEYLKGAGPLKGDILKKEASIFTFGDLLSYFPYRHIDRTRFYKVRELNPDMPSIQLKGKIGYPQLIGQNRGKRLIANFQDETGTVELIWFKGIRWIEKIFKPGSEYIVFGKPNYFKGKFSIPHPEMELVTNSINSVKMNLQPVYNTTEKMKVKNLDSRGIESLMKALLVQLDRPEIPENLPDELIEKYRLVSRFKAYADIHFPKTPEDFNEAKRRLKFEELFLLQLKLLNLKLNRKGSAKGFILKELGDKFNKFYEDHLPFELTGAQKKVLKEIRRDLISGKQMNRLLQGDVGSGKTIVALITMLMALDNGFQAALMAPTEILAQQHYQGLSEILAEMDIRIRLLTGSVKSKERKEILHQLEAGDIDLLIGTHALIEDVVKFKNLGVVVIDEQHRFGVAQRAKLWKKNISPPHVLVMTATPIPRTLAMTVYGDLDVSVIDELPPGRKPVHTIHCYDSDRLKVFGFMKKEIKKGRQVYVVYPLINESENFDYKDLMDGYESIVREFPLPEFKVSIVHGQMKSDVKEYEMQQFVNGRSNIMVATTVIEVGVNVPNASVMVIESSERFGLSQLHQLRGRVGRGAEKSYCILMTGNKLGHEARQRIKTMTATNDGFKIAEVDMDLRGPGDIEGTQQSGILNFKIANLATDQPVLQEARKAATAIFDSDPDLRLPKHASLKRYLLNQKEGTGSWSRIS